MYRSHICAQLYSVGHNRFKICAEQCQLSLMLYSTATEENPEYQCAGTGLFSLQCTEQEFQGGILLAISIGLAPTLTNRVNYTFPLLHEPCTNVRRHVAEVSPCGSGARRRSGGRRRWRPERCTRCPGCPAGRSPER